MTPDPAEVLAADDPADHLAARPGPVRWDPFTDTNPDGSIADPGTGERRMERAFQRPVRFGRHLAPPAEIPEDYEPDPTWGYSPDDLDALADMAADREYGRQA